MYLGFYLDLIKTFCKFASAYSIILKEFFNYPRENAIFPSNSEVFDNSVCYNCEASAFISKINS
jgi:hypothetical protein